MTMERKEKLIVQKSFFQFLIKYLENSSFHGAFQLARVRHRHPIETIFWISTIIALITLSSMNAQSFWYRYLYNPTVVTIDRDYLNRNVTFPPVTLCLRNKLNETAMEEFLMERNIDATNKKLRRFLNNLAHFTLNSLNELINEQENYFAKEHLIDIVMKISNKLPNNITVSTTGEIFFFDPIVTDELGLCYSFNSRISAHLSPNSIISGNEDFKLREKSLEEINFFDGDASAVVADLDNNVDVYYHGPNELPSSLQKITNVDVTQKSFIKLSLIPIITKSEENTRKLFEFQRKCKFEEESSLVYFPQIYTRSLCRLDCRMRKLRQICNCLPFFYRRKGDDRQCSKQELKCIIKHKDVIDVLASIDCPCLQDCNDVKYSLQQSSTLFWFHKSRVQWTVAQSKVTFKRELIHGFVEALVSTGANLSLCLGISSLSIVEILFFAYLLVKRWIYKIFKHE